MTRSQSNYFNMAKAVCDIFNSNNQLWQDNELIAEGVAKLTGLCSDVNRESAMQLQNDTKGYTASKEQARTRLEDLLYRVSSRVKVYAQKNGDKVTFALVSFSRSSLDQLSLNKLLIKARSVVDTCNGLLQELEPYRVKQEDVDELQQSIEATEGLNAHRDVVFGQRSENTSHLAGLFAKLREELKLMDTQVDAYIDDEEFLKAYFNTRRIHDVKSGGAPKKQE